MDSLLITFACYAIYWLLNRQPLTYTIYRWLKPLPKEGTALSIKVPPPVKRKLVRQNAISDHSSVRENLIETSTDEPPLSKHSLTPEHESSYELPTPLYKETPVYTPVDDV